MLRKWNCILPEILPSQIQFNTTLPQVRVYLTVIHRRDYPLFKRDCLPIQIVSLPMSK